MKQWRRALCLALALILAICVIPSAAPRASAEITSGSCGSLRWEYDSDTETLTISGTGWMYFEESAFEEPIIPWAEFSDSVETIVIEEGARNIAEEAFSDFRNLTAVSIPNTVSTIGYSSFWGCKKLSSLVIPDSVESIEDQAFYNCMSLKSISFGAGLTTIEQYVFGACESLTELELPESLTEIGSGAFYRCKSVTSVRLPDSLINYDSSIFRYCTALKRAELGQNCTSLTSNMFADCVSLEEIYLPEGFSSIGSSALNNTPALRDIYYGSDEEAWTQISNVDSIDLRTVRLHCGVDQIDGHWFGTELAPTCSQPGFIDKTCPCGFVWEETLQPLPHSMGAWMYNNDGTHSRSCSVCGQAYETADCSFEEDVIPATATDPGFTVYTCSACGYSYIDNYEEPLGEAFTVRFSVPDGIEQPADMTSYTNRVITLPAVEAPEGYAFMGWVLEDYDNVSDCPETILTGSYTAPCDLILKALFRYVPVSDICYELVTEKLPESEKPGRYVLTTGKTTEAFMMKATTGSYTDNPDAKTRISASGTTLTDGVLRNVPVENIFHITLSDTEERYYLSPVSLPGRCVSISGTTLTTATTLSDSCKWRIGYASRTGRYGFIPHTDETRCINCDGAAFVLSTIQGNSGQFLWKEKDAGTVYYTTVISYTPMETDGLNIYSNISVGTDMVVNLTVRKSDVANYRRFWIEVVKHEPEEDKTFLYGEGQPDGALIEKESTWTVRFTHICAKEMGVGIDVRVCAEDENGRTWMSPVRSANIRDYLAGRLTATNNKVEQRVLAADMLNYGAAAQMFLNYETDHLVNQELTVEQLAKLHEYETKELPAVNKINYNVRPDGQSNILFISVTLGNKVVNSLIVLLDQGTENVQFLVKDHATGAVVTTLDTVWMGSSFQATFDDIGADKMRTEYDFVTLVNGVETGNTRTWSVEGYVGEIRAANLPLMTAMGNALLTYGDSAAAYFAAQ